MGENDVIDINRNSPHKVSEVICVSCTYRWIAVRPEGVLLKSMTCPNCGVVGAVIETGEDLENAAYQGYD